MTAVLTHLGRAVILRPGSLGQLFEQPCTVVRKERQVTWDRGKRKITSVDVPVPMFWYDTDKDGQQVFCAYAGYADRIERTLRERGIYCEIEYKVDFGLQPDFSALAGTVLRQFQKEALSKILAYPGGVIDCPTASGKTFLIKTLARVCPTAKIVVTVPSCDVADDIYNGLKYDIHPSELGRVGDGHYTLRRVTVAVTQSLHKCDKSANLVLVDECHSVLTENYIQMFNKYRRAKIFGFTASPEGKSDGSDGFLEAIFGPVLTKMSYQEGVSAGNIVQLQVRMYRSDVGPNVTGMQDDVKANRTSLWLNLDRNQLIARVVRDLEREIGPDQQLLIMVDKTEHAYALGQLLPEFPIVSGEVSPEREKEMRAVKALVDGQVLCTPNLRTMYKRMFERHELKRAIATRVWSKGVDFRDLAVLVRAEGTRSKHDSIQVPGRLSRLGRETEKQSGLLVDFLDTFSPNLLARSNARKAVYRENGWAVQII